MLDQKKVHMMTQIADYEQGIGKKDIKMYQYKREVYLSIQTIETFFVVTAAFLLATFLYMMNYYSDIIKKGFTFSFKAKMMPVAVVYVFVMIVALFVSGYQARKRYDDMVKRILDYDKKLQKLEHYVNKDKTENIAITEEIISEVKTDESE